MSENPRARHIVADPEHRGGRPRIAGRGITVAFIAELHERLGVGAADIASDYGLSLADVYAALAYYHDHREEIDRREAEDLAYIEELRRNTPSLLAAKLGRDKL